MMSFLMRLKCLVFLFCCLMRPPVSASDTNGGQMLDIGSVNLVQPENIAKFNSDDKEIHKQIDMFNENSNLSANYQIMAPINPTQLMTVSHSANSATLDQSMNSFSEILLGILQLLSPSCHLVIAYDEAHSTSQELGILMHLPLPHTVNEQEKIVIGYTIL